MDLTPENIRELRATYSQDFQSGYDEADVFQPRIASEVQSSGPQNLYGWANQLPSLREWIGTRVVQNFAASSYALENKTWELTLGIKREHIEDDNLGTYSMTFQQSGQSARKHPDELLVVLLQDGHSLECFDGQNFFDTDHPVNPYDASFSTYSNYSASGLALTQANFLIARGRMMAFKGEQGRHLRVRPSLLVVPPALEGAAIEILKNERTASGASNTTRGMADYLVIDELSGQDTTWYLLDTRKPIKPFVYQLRRRFYMTVKNLRDDQVVLEENEVRFYGDMRDNAGFSLPFLAYKAAA